MRIGIDMLAIQSPLSRGRGIGRYSRALLKALLEVDPETEYLFYLYPGLPSDDLPEAPNVSLRWLPERENLAMGLDELTRQDPDRLDALLLLSPFEYLQGYAPPARSLDGPPLAAILYDLIPFLFQEQYLTWPPTAMFFYRSLERLRRYEMLLAISEATRDDARRMLGLGADQVVSISGASDPNFFRPASELEANSEASLATLRRFGINQPFVFCLGSMDDRKNLRGLIDAFALLPESVREARQLVITFAIKEEEARTIREYADSREVGPQLVLTGGVSDEVLRELYRHCEVFAFPSLYEGFGLPLLEAMQCGAVVLGGNNSSQPEVVGDAGLLANASDSNDVAAKLNTLLTDAELLESLRERGREQSRKFRWESSALKTRDAIQQIAQPRSRPSRSRRLRSDTGHRPRPRLAVFSPWPPKRSGISDYTERLVLELADSYAIDLYHDPGYLPDLALRSGKFGCFDARTFPRRAKVQDYRGILYQMGNSHYHRYVYETLLDYPGIVTLHDFCLAGFHAWYAHQALKDPQHFELEIRRTHPERAEAVLEQLDDWSLEPGGLGDACARRDLHLNRRVFERAEALIVHSNTIRDQAARIHPDRADRLWVVPSGSEVKQVSEETRRAIRRRFGIPEDALVFGSFGILHEFKLNRETVEAFAPIARRRPEATLIFVGEDLTGSAVRDRADELGLSTRVRFLGRQPAQAFEDLLGAVDVGISLRKPPTNGESSAALLHLFRHGVACIVNDTGTFGEFPDEVVLKLQWEADGLDGLTRALGHLADDRQARERLGQAARDRIEEVHDWSRVAAQYAEVIESYAELREEALFASRNGPHFRSNRSPVRPGSAIPQGARGG